MPMSFPDMKALEQAAEVHSFRKPNEGESEKTYRDALADHVEPIDFIESLEIRNGVGWNKFSDEQNRDMLRRSALRSRR